MIENMNKVFFTPGNTVTIKHDIDNKPVMLVRGKASKMIKDEEGDDNHFLGIRCFWFTAVGEYQEQIFSTKDLIHV